MATALYPSDSLDRLLWISGQFTTTVKHSWPVGAIETLPRDISTTIDPHTIWSGSAGDKLYKHSGRFTSTEKDSQTTTTWGATTPRGGAQNRAGDIVWADHDDKLLYLISGQFSTTIKASESISGYASDITGASADVDNNTSWASQDDRQMFVMSGQFTSTLKTSISVSSDDLAPTNAAYSAGETLWSGLSTEKLFRNSGYFTLTVRDSRSYPTNEPQGIDTGELVDRLQESDLTKSFTIDAAIAVGKNQTKTFTIDAAGLYWGGLTKSFTVDARLFWQGLLKSFTIDAAIAVGKNQTKTFTLDAVLEPLAGDPDPPRPIEYDPDFGTPGFHENIIVVGHNNVYFGEF